MASRSITSGDIAHFSDGQRVHTGVVLDVSSDGDAWALFVTSSPEWNRRSRLLTSDEHKLFGFKRDDGKSDYFAPVIRLASDAIMSGVTYPKHRIVTLIKEFGPSPFVKSTKVPEPISVKILPPIRVVQPQMPIKTFAGYVTDELARLKLKPAEIILPDDKDELMRGAIMGEKTLPRKELRSLINTLPGILNFFIRRASITANLQSLWRENGELLQAHRDQLGISRYRLSALMGLSERDIVAFESGLQSPSWNEVLTILAFLPGMTDDWSLPTGTPLLADYIMQQVFKRKWTYARVSSMARIPQNRIKDILASCQRPNQQESSRLSNVFPGLPPWRPWLEKLDTRIPLDKWSAAK